MRVALLGVLAVIGFRAESCEVCDFLFIGSFVNRVPFWLPNIVRHPYERNPKGILI